MLQPEQRREPCLGGSLKATNESHKDCMQPAGYQVGSLVLAQVNLGYNFTETSESKLGVGFSLSSGNLPLRIWSTSGSVPFSS